jgi:uncharacterized protein (UPF0332 family)
MKDDIEYLLEKAKESLDAAALLNHEGYPGFAASRAYYSMFYVAEALLLDIGLSFSSHSAVISAFGREFIRAGKIDAKFHRYLIDAQDLRNLGDYGVGKKISPEQAQEILSWSREFISVAEAILK